MGTRGMKRYVLLRRSNRILNSTATRSIFVKSLCDVYTYCEFDVILRFSYKFIKNSCYLTNRSRNEFVIPDIIGLPIRITRVMFARNIIDHCVYELLTNLIVDRSNRDRWSVFFFILFPYRTHYVALIYRNWAIRKNLIGRRF